jgi:O-antigen/teichoic acid export membrane protein
MKRIRSLLAKYDTDNLYRDSLLVILLTNVGSVTNLLFHVVMGNMLSADQYAVLASLLGVYLIFTTPTLAIQNTLAHFAGHMDQSGRRGDIRRLSRQWLIRISMVLLPLGILAALLTPLWRDLMHLESGAAVLIVLGMIISAFYLPVFVGALQGVQSFFWMCVTANGWAVIRIVVGAVMVIALGALAVYGLAGHLAGVLLSLVVGVIIFLRYIPGGQETTLPLERSDKYLFLSIISLFSFSVLMTGDVVLVKMFFAEEADYAPYSQASTIARIIFFVCQPIANALFPKVISKGTRSSGHNTTLWKALGLSGLAIFGAVFVCILIPRVPLFVLYHVTDASPHLISLVRWVTVAIAPLGLTFMIMNFEMAQHRFGFVAPLIACATVFVVGTWLFHSSLLQFVLVLGMATYTSLAVMLFYLFRKEGAVLDSNGRISDSAQAD